MSRAALTFVTIAHEYVMVERMAPSPPRAGIRARNRAAIEEEILEIGRAHLARDGAAALSLRAIARDLGMVSSALYRYVANRDDLLTLLIVAAFTSLGDAVDQAHAQAPADDLTARWQAVGHAIRGWALAHPHEYALVYGSPVPDYQAPAEQTSGPGTRVLQVLLALLADATRTGELARDGFTTHLTEDLTPAAQAAVGTTLDDAFFAGSGIDADTLMAGLAAWSLLMGTISAEVFGQLGADTLTDPDASFGYLLEVARRLVLRS
jgi:AcrR family transcriptional regulator